MSRLGADEPGLKVSPVTVLYAFRYGLGRRSYAHKDALLLIRQHWSELERYKDTILSDLDFEVRRDDSASFGENARSSAQLADWIRSQG